MSSAHQKSKSINTEEIAKLVQGKLVGANSVSICGISSLEDANSGDLSFFAPTSAKTQHTLKPLLSSTKASALLVREEMEELRSATQIVVKDPLLSLIAVAKAYFVPQNYENEISPEASVHSTATIGENVSIGAFSVIGKGSFVGSNTVLHPHVVVYPGAYIGEGCTLHSGAVVREGVQMGNRCVLQNGAIIGADGFGYRRTPDGKHAHIPHLGTAILKEGVEVGANSTIDRGMLSNSEVGEESKIDNLVQLGHNTKIGMRSLLCSQVGVSGSTTIGDDCVLGGKSGVADHIKVGNRVRVAAKSGVTQNTGDDIELAGMPALKATDWRRNVLLIKDLRKLFKTVKELKEKSE